MSDSLIRANRALLEQGVEVLAGLDDRLYTEAGRRGASVGDHLRHILDHYTCFFGGLAAGAIDYEARRRDAEIARRRSAGTRALHEAERRLAALDRSRMSALVRVALDDGAEPGETAVSTVKRELQFLFSHTIHHYALIAERLTEAGVAVGEEFGVAPSTLRHRESARAMAWAAPEAPVRGTKPEGGSVERPRRRDSLGVLGFASADADAA